jgi:hypothetical protein
LCIAKLVAVAAKFRTGGEPARQSMRPATRCVSSPAVTSTWERIGRLDVQLDRMVAAAATELVVETGAGTHTGAALLVTAGDKPERLAGEAPTSPAWRAPCMRPPASSNIIASAAAIATRTPRCTSGSHGWPPTRRPSCA